jgi:ketosteroid isomerase-like protein
MSELDDFLAWTTTEEYAAEVAIHNGDVAPRLAIWSRDEPVTLLGAVYTATGWPDVSSAFRRVAASFRDCIAYEREVVAAGVSGDLAYTVAYERSTGTMRGEPNTHTLRVTHVYRREDGAWRVVHRHADAPPAVAT